MSEEGATVALSETEMSAIQSAINEAIEAVEDWEFQTRLGVEKDYLLRLSAKLEAAKMRLR